MDTLKLKNLYKCKKVENAKRRQLNPFVLQKMKILQGNFIDKFKER